MADPKHQGVMAMVNIDGSKVKQLREQKALTQLYVATAVQVTTDTISRWENKRYPTIKKENALRLAEALEVELNDILEQPTDKNEESDANAPHKGQAKGANRTISDIWPLLILSGTIGVLITIITWFFLQIPPPPTLAANRILPNRYTIGEPFPVTIEVLGAETTSVTLILKENIPENVTISSTEPVLPKSGFKKNTLKWLQKTEGRALFTYIATIATPLSSNAIFSGTVAAGDNTDTPIPISGNNTLQPGFHHWADTDGDNIINDKEILTVYDQYGDLEKLGIDIDLIEEIWLGSGYRWDQTTKSYEILP